MVRRILETIITAAPKPIPDRRERQAPDDSIEVRYPIREYQSAQSSQLPAPSFQFLYRINKGTAIRGT
jgi:hypothetical protein